MTRNIIQITVGLIMAGVTYFTWGSIGSALTGIGLVTLITTKLYQLAMDKRDEVEIDWED